MLLLFDIDGTLLSTSGAGMRAMERAGRRLFGPDFDVAGIAYAGRLDPLIVADMFRCAGREPTREAVSAFRAAYAAEMPAELERSRDSARALPGVLDLLGALGRVRHERLVVGLLTGNYPETGGMKLTACGVPEAAFAITVWGDESPSDPPTRDDLPRVGMGKYAAARGRALRGEEVVVIGDTPHDVRCAQVNGCRSLAVATGGHGVEDLRRAGADWAVDDLSDTRRVVEWLLRAG